MDNGRTPHVDRTHATPHTTLQATQRNATRHTPHAMQRNNTARYRTIPYDTTQYHTIRQAKPSHAMPRHAMPSHVMMTQRHNDTNKQHHSTRLAGSTRTTELGNNGLQLPVAVHDDADHDEAQQDKAEDQANNGAGRHAPLDTAARTPGTTSTSATGTGPCCQRGRRQRRRGADIRGDRNVDLEVCFVAEVNTLLAHDRNGPACTETEHQIQNLRRPVRNIHAHTRTRTHAHKKRTYTHKVVRRLILAMLYFWSCGVWC